MSSLSVLVYDDQIAIAKEIARKIEEAYPFARTKPAEIPDLQQLIELMSRRRTEWRRNSNSSPLAEEHPADQADIIVVDYDLFQYVETTGSQLAYRLRCFSECGFIAILNGYRRRNVFDASLSSPIVDFADLHISDVQIENKGLWRTPFKGYRPWYWPVIPEAITDFENCISDVRNNFDEPILAFLGLQEVIDWIPERALTFLTREPDVEKVTFRSFIESDRGGIDPRDAIGTAQLARVAAAQIRALLNSIILPEQSILIDAPHLISRFPSLITRGRDEITEWNRLCDPVDPPIEELLNECLKDHRFQKDHWLSRPAWYWPNVKRDKRVEEVKSPWTPKEGRWLFCENISRFAPVEYTQPFRAIVSPPFVQRYVFMSDSADAIRKVEQRRDQSALDSSTVEYIPQANFSM